LATTRKKRRRRRPEEAEAEILSAADALIRTRPWSEVTVERVMAHTSLARETFYLYFPDRHRLLVRLLERLRGDIDSIAAPWRERVGEPDDESGRQALRGLVELYVEHGAVLRALSAAAGQDPAAEQAWREFVEAGDRRSAERIRAGMRSGLIAGLDPDRTARALCAMNREYLFQTVVGRPDADVEAVVDTLHAIWWRALYGVAPPDRG
jgi:TetR/AcrR family transcriptional regulator, ethionamide resistance regulator